MAADKTNHQIKLKDGRMLGYAEYGNPEGKLVFYFHGFPSSRLDWPTFDAGVAAELNARIIAVDRPGTGLSDFKRGREILDWPDDVIELADALQLGRFAVLGISGGGPYAAACAFKIPGRLTATGIVCGMAPSEALRVKEGISWFWPGKSPEERKQMLMGMAGDLDQFASGMNQAYPEGHPDSVMLNQPELISVFMHGLREAFRSGIDGVEQDAALYARPWRCRLQDITAEVHLWHGELDLNVPISAGRYVADNIPNCHAKFLPDEGHFSIIPNNIEEILIVLVA
ncbi:alpha/beta fold hydrolase [Chloroflexota bacterium]